ncbi:hypothetical protein H5410_023235 [Solanum commersonii]|uniref:Uncharacterized protein n=1 Tax=Solanum commersonii TaxID=4109 RepID=A0A9J5ZGZ6_SOLCO|nr:hypothetical protein H5410_023235 [Solanum commersonii]
MVENDLSLHLADNMEIEEWKIGMYRRRRRRISRFASSTVIIFVFYSLLANIGGLHISSMLRNTYITNFKKKKTRGDD